MTAKNKDIKGAHISECKFHELVRLFSVDLGASQIASLTGLSRNTVNRYLKATKVRLAEFCDSKSPFRGEVLKSMNPSLALGAVDHKIWTGVLG